MTPFLFLINVVKNSMTRGVLSCSDSGINIAKRYNREQVCFSRRYVFLCIMAWFRSFQDILNIG